MATLSSGKKYEHPKYYMKSQAKLAKLQRAKKKKQVTNLHAKIANQRKDFIHKTSNEIAKNNSIVIVGDVSSSRMSKTRMAKSTLDAGWYDFKQKLSYKTIRYGGRYMEVSERFTTQVCSDCGGLPHERPKGISSLGIREWTCEICGSHHDRDVNAARNILAIGLDSLAEGAAI